MKKKVIFLLLISALFLIQAGSPAHAYLDPGTGSMMLQALLGAIGGALVVGRLYWTKIKTFFAGRKQVPPLSEPNKEPFSDKAPKDTEI